MCAGTAQQGHYRGGWRPVRDAYIRAAIVASFSITPGQRQTDAVQYDDLNGGTFQLCKED